MKTTRNGRHKDGKTLFGAYVEPEVKALATLVSEKSGATFTDLILDGVNHFATREGILKNGKITPEYESSFKLAVAMVKAKIANNKKKGK